ncbi:MAG TPA: DinB family protein [Pyrinomonadaceae bacterium]|nr:DinB family protein [Pyrinomonadaceae bacterium]
MSRIQEIADQLNEETPATEKMLARIPDDKLDWKPHERSMSLGQLAGHVADMYGWLAFVIGRDELDFAEPYDYPQQFDSAALVAYLKKRVEESHKTLQSAASDDVLNETWTLRNGDQILWQDKKNVVVRSTFGHIAHHRGQLAVYLRLLDIPVPAIYGPSADEGQM